MMHRSIRQFVDFFIVRNIALATDFYWRMAPDQIPILPS